jgi:hypothetical protein
MKAAAVILIVLVLAAVGGLGYLYLTSSLDVSFVSCIATEAASQPDFWKDLTFSLESGTFVGTRYTSDQPGPAESCQFLSYTVHVSNRTRLPAEVIEVRITPMQGDILQLGDLEERRLPSGRETDLNVTILTARDMHSVREATVSYYFWGIPFTAKITLGR